MLITGICISYFPGLSLAWAGVTFGRFPPTCPPILPPSQKTRPSYQGGQNLNPDEALGTLSISFASRPSRGKRKPVPPPILSERSQRRFLHASQPTQLPPSGRHKAMGPSRWCVRAELLPVLLHPSWRDGRCSEPVSSSREAAARRPPRLGTVDAPSRGCSSWAGRAGPGPALLQGLSDSSFPPLLLFPRQRCGGRASCTTTRKPAKRWRSA